MASAELIAIGTELLLGEIQDTNTRYLTRQLRILGIDVFRTTIIGDNPIRIAEVMQESLRRSDIVITTGGLGPTVDDPTRDAAALAFHRAIEFHPELWDQIEARFQKKGKQPSENNKKQAFLPKGAFALQNPVGTAPAFYLDQNPGILICLPGVPSEMVTIFENSVIPLLKQINGSANIIKIRVLHTCLMGESLIDASIDDLERLQNPTVGLSAHPASVDIRITAKADCELTAREMILKVETEIRKRLPGVVYGADELTLPQAINHLARQSGLKILIALSNGAMHLIDKFEMEGSDFARAEIQGFSVELAGEQKFDEKIMVLGVNLTQGNEFTSLDVYLSFHKSKLVNQFLYNGPFSMTDTWAVNTSLGYLWKQLITIVKGDTYEKS